ncbi:DNA translocase FtsK [Marinospirillum alkaliphilum]|uniref:DNA translocase FtsK n=1 Tax=Marinospirillum alkaliphilum DSM 21637 TaxID=1122209 RepID=A0A1K1TUT7_9GAMM|nr:DNA translocase FtsK [Marinospirillum alkaliphilum]SFX04068.1 DNA segregation ATPase FtsK/SpoIIIE, S-DNA-T family [Marinospirillum alkaliphilum DSM 21637]
MNEQDNRLAARLRKATQEAGVLLLALVALMLLLALFSFNAADPGWNRVSTAAPTNLMGLSGAWLADVLFSLMGFAAWLLPAALLHLSIQLLRRPWQQEDWDPFIPSLRFLGLVLLLIGVSGIAARHFHALETSLPYGAGGILGESLSSLAGPLLGHLGSTLIFLTACFAGFSLITGWSWLTIMDEIGHLLVRLAERARNAWQDADQLRREEKQRYQDEMAYAAELPGSEKSQPEEPQEGWLPRLRERLPKLESTPVRTDIERAEPRLGDFSDDLPEPEEGPAPRLLTLKDLQPERNQQPQSLEGDRPGLNLLDAPKPQKVGFTAQELESLALLLQQKLKEFGVQAEVVDVHPGPVITRFELELAAGVKSSKVANLALDLARALRVPSVRVVEVIAGKSTIGIELPNSQRALIRLLEVLNHDDFLQDRHPLPLALGQDISGRPVVVNLAKMPHLLVAGTTGSGKSVGVNAMLLSLLLQRSPEELRLIMIDPKMLELSVYEGIPHLLAPVVTDMKEAANALRWCVAEMERRYQLMAAMGVRNIAGFNEKLAEAEAQGARVADPLKEPVPGAQPAYLEKLPYVVVVIDEFADMMMLVGKKVEELIARLAQKARAAGIHLILATQRPSVDVITGLIKANIPTRVAFQVSSKIDSRTILDQGGAEQLLGNGDMLYLPTGAPQPERIHGAFVADDEVHRIVENWKLRGEPDYEESILSGDVEAQALAGLEAEGMEGNDDENDPLYDEAVAFVIESRRASTSSVQRRFKIGYNRAARLVDAMERAGLVSPLQSNGQRELLIPER